MYRAKSRPGHNTTVFSIHVPQTVLQSKGTGQWACLGYQAESTWATLCAGVIATARRASVIIWHNTR